MGLIPDEIVTGLKLEGQGKVAIALAGIDAEFKARGTQSIKINAPTEAVQKELKDLGFKVEHMKDGRVKITAKTEDAKKNLKDFIDTAGKVPSNKAVRMTAETQKAILDLGAVSKKVGSVKGRSFTMTALTGTARSVLEDLGFKIESVPGAKGAKALKITVPEGTPKSQAGRIQAAIDALHGKLITNTVTTVYKTQAGPAMNKPMPNANGNIVRFAQGGVRMANNLVKAFANGSEKHIAQIARPGQIRLWNEPETQGEAYLPLAKSKRTRSKAILDRVAEIFGGKVVYFANGGIRPPTSQAAALNRQTRITRTASASSAGASSLVGGDLNINVGAVSTVGDAMEDAMFELRKIRLGGGGGNA
jgi:phosphoribosylformylglycinamidine (FGAM) synthase PurS component